MGSDPIPAAVASVSSEPDGSGAAVAVTALYRANALSMVRLAIARAGRPGTPVIILANVPTEPTPPDGVTPTASSALLVTGGAGHQDPVSGVDLTRGIALVYHPTARRLVIAHRRQWRMWTNRNGK